MSGPISEEYKGETHMLNTREEAFALLRRYNQEPFHILHALTVE